MKNKHWNKHQWGVNICYKTTESIFEFKKIKNEFNLII